MAWSELFGSSIGLLSLFTIGFVVVMAGYLCRFAARHMVEDEQKERSSQL